MRKQTAALMSVVLLAVGILASASAPVAPLPSQPGVTGPSDSTSVAPSRPEGAQFTFLLVNGKTVTQKQFRATWTAANEMLVVAYQVWASPSQRGVTRPISKDIAPAGGSYAVLCPSQSAAYIQIHAIMVDGSVVTSATVKVTK